MMKENLLKHFLKDKFQIKKKFKKRPYLAITIFVIFHVKSLHDS